MSESTDPENLRNWHTEDLMKVARAAGILWLAAGGSDPLDVLADGQRELLDRAAASYLLPAPQTGATTVESALAEVDKVRNSDLAFLYTCARDYGADSTPAANLRELIALRKLAIAVLASRTTTEKEDAS
jgi:hypothetical protein